MIYYDKFETWAGDFRDLIVDLVGKHVVGNLAASSFEYVEDAGDYLATHTDILTASSEIQSWLQSREFCVFHGTRLLPEEILSVQRTGLQPLRATDREQRLREILDRHPKWFSVKDKLCEVLADVGPGEKQGRRERQVHFSLSRSGLVNGFDHYLTHGSEFDQHVVRRLFGDRSGLQLLNSETVPILVHVRINGGELIRGTHPYSSYSDVVDMGEIPGLARTFLDAWAFKTAKPSFEIAKLQTDCCMMQQVATPPERILNIEKLGDLAAV
ncbi:hypothetical protein [Aliiroseovarius sp.]|uniref:hypothetical protein n=1 Tax=Aliiroseovarius sp. TaxID=1872442 RepID=UPI003BA920C6